MTEKGGLSPWKQVEGILFPGPAPVVKKPPRKEEKNKEEKSDDEQVITNLQMAIPATVSEEPELKEETKVVSDVPKEDEGEGWEILSDRAPSISSLGLGGGVFVARAGSVRSINSFDNSGSSCNMSGSVPFKIQRTHSNSTIDSENGDKTLGVKDVDYVEHIVLPSDTLQGLCLAYKISATRIRQANQFSGSNLNGAPKKLYIPLTRKAMRAGFIRVQDKESHVYKIHAFLAELPDLKEAEARGYLELADWVVEEAVQSAKEDGEWEQEVEGDDEKSGDIHITVEREKGVAVGFTAKGAGLSPRRKEKAKSSKSKVEIFDGVPAIATKSVRPQDVYDAAPQHNEFGVELKEIQPKASNP